MEKIISEACVEGFTQAKLAEEKGADRIELCENLSVGGTTPSYGTIKIAKNLLKIPIFVIIRPRGGNFVYTDNELEIIYEDIRICNSLGVDGIVIGVLNSKGQIDKEILTKIISLSKPMKITFHMAFDVIEDKSNAIEELIKLEIDRILTRGGENFVSAIEGKESIKNFIQLANGRIIILPGGGITRENKNDLAKYLQVTEIHGTKVVGSLSS